MVGGLWQVLSAAALIGCGTEQPASSEGDGSKIETTEGSFVVDAEGLAFGDLAVWQASLEASHDFDAASEGREVVVYRLQAGAANADDSQSFGVRLFGSTWTELTSGDVTLATVDVSGERNQVDASIDPTSWVSNGGSMTVASFQDGKIVGTVETTLVEPGAEAGAAATATFEGAIEPSCHLYSFPAEGEGEWQDVGVEDARCAALFE